MTPDLYATVDVPLAQEPAFELFTRGLARWWPREFTWSGTDLLLDIGVEPREGGLLFELGPYGFRIDFGRVLTWSPPTRLAFTWQIGPDRLPVPDPARVSEVDVGFQPEGAGTTRVELTHREWDRHGDQAGRYREQMAPAWPYALQRFADAAAGQA